MPPDFGLLANPTRLRILQLTWDRERSAGEIAAATQVSFGAVSQQLKRLREGGVLHHRRAGRHRYYRANRRALGPLAAVLEAFWYPRLAHLKSLAQAEASYHEH